MFSFRIFVCRVVRFSPSRSAAPPLPDRRPDVSFNAVMMALDSA